MTRATPFYVFDAIFTRDSILTLVVSATELQPPQPRTFPTASGHLANIVTSGDSLVTLSGTMPGTAQSSPSAPPGAAIIVAVNLTLTVSAAGSNAKLFELLGTLNGESVRAAGSDIQVGPGGVSVGRCQWRRNLLC